MTEQTSVQGLHAEPVLIFDAGTQEEAEIVHATLIASGISAFLDHVEPSPVAGAVDPVLGATWRRGVYVHPTDVDAAREILTSTQTDDESLVEEQEADGNTLQDAERRANSE